MIIVCLFLLTNNYVTITDLKSDAQIFVFLCLVILSLVYFGNSLNNQLDPIYLASKVYVYEWFNKEL